jgi:hypothetical protein
MNEYEHEPVRGLPEELPEGEYIVWQGEPTWRGLARRVFRVHALGLYFGALIVAHASYEWLEGVEPASVLMSAGWQLSLTAIALGILSAMALAYARTTVYTITNRRLVIRSGVAVPMMINVPWDSVQAANLRQCHDGTGDIAFEMMPAKRAAYWALWPNVRPWHHRRAQPMIRGVHSPETVAQLLAQTVTNENWAAASAAPKAVTGVAIGSAIAAS